MKGRVRLGKKKSAKNLILVGTGLAAVGGVLKAAARKHCEPEDIDEGNPYLVSSDKGQDGVCLPNPSRYEKTVKPAVDQALSFAGLIMLSPLYAAIALAIYMDDKGPVFFAQKRVGKDKKFFSLHKFRSMKMSAPHDVPTHQLQDPDQYLTRIGKILRKTSLDELPQLWDIFRGKMSIIGPRPGLWNQKDLIEARDRYGANRVMPGLTGLAQIRGRDELEIAVKASLDGEYVRTLRLGGAAAVLQDVQCFIGTIGAVLKHEGVVEGGTGAFDTADAKEGGFEDYGYLKQFHINTSSEKRVLITGEGSYIGESFRQWAGEHYPNIEIHTVNMTDDGWREKCFEGYDCVFHVAGIAHADVDKVSEEDRQRYYAVNRDLAVETAKKAKDIKVSQFVFMSSMIIYGDSGANGKGNIINEHTVPSPSNFYGDSKRQADIGVRRLASDRFKVAVLRPPMIYGAGSKGNYPKLSKLAKTLPVFPDIDNQRSMLYIDNLCEFLCLLILSGEGGIYFPQNKTYTKTADMVKQVAAVSGKHVYVSKVFNPAVMIAERIPGRVGGLAKKAFGSSIYDQKLSVYDGLEYRVVSFEESIRQTEADRDGKPLHILIVSQYFYPETFRINDMAAEWIKRGYRVTVVTGIPNYPEGKFFEGYGYCSRRHEMWKGIEIIRIPLIPRGAGSMGMAANYFSFAASGWWWKTVSRIKADLVFTFEVSPMSQALIGCWYAKKHRIPHFLYVQDLWPENVEVVTGIHSPAVLWPINRMVDYIYRNADRIFTTSPSFVDAIVKRRVPVEKRKVCCWPQYAEEFYKPLEGPAAESRFISELEDDNAFKIVFTGNIGTAQGLDILPRTANELRNFFDSHNEERKFRFVIVGDGRYQRELEKEIERWGVRDSFIRIPRQPAEMIPSILACCDAAFLSFNSTKLWEMTIPAKLQSYMACGMPIIAAAKGETERVIREAECGICCPIGDSKKLAEGIRKIAGSDLKAMSVNGQAYCREHFNKAELMDRMDEEIMRAVQKAGNKRCVQ